VLDQDLSEVFAVNVQAALEFDSSEKASASNLLEETLVEFQNFLLEKGALLGRVLGQAFIDDDANCGFGDSHSKRIATIGASVVSRLNHIHDVLVAKDPAYGNHSTRNTLSHDQNVCSDVFVILCKQFSSAAEACLNLVHDQ